MSFLGVLSISLKVLWANGSVNTFERKLGSRTDIEWITL